MTTFKKRIIIIFVFAMQAAFAAFFIFWAKEDSQPSQINQTNMKEVKQKTIVAFGDSLTKGYGVSAQESYPAISQEKIRGNGLPHTVKNMGISGETSAQGLKRIDDIIAQKPDIVILELGINDELRRMDVNQTRKNLSLIIERLRKENIEVVLAGFLSPWAIIFPDNEFNLIYPQLAEKYNLAFIPYFLNGVSLNSDLNLEDSIHPNEKGYQKIVEENVWPILKKIL